MRIFITGASGFIGRAITRALASSGHSLSLLQRSNPSGDSRVVLGDIQIFRNNPERLKQLLEQIQPDAVVHLAWASIQKHERETPLHYEVNLRFTQDLIDLLYHHFPQCYFLGAGSQAEYGPLNRLLTPQTPCTPLTAYGITKKLAGEYARARLPNRSAWLRILTAYGPGDHSTKFIPYLVQCYSQDLQAAISPGQQEWDFLHVDDLAQAFRTATENRILGTHILAAHDTLSFRQLALKLWEIARTAGFNPPKPQFGARPYLPSELYYLAGDSSTFRRLSGWTPALSLEAGLRTLLPTSGSHP